MQMRPISRPGRCPAVVSRLSSLALLAALFAGLAAPARATETLQPTTWASATADGNPYTGGTGYTAGTWTNTTQGVIVTLHATDPGDTPSDSNIQGIRIISVSGTFDASHGLPISSGFIVPGASGTLPPVTEEGSTVINYQAFNKQARATSAVYVVQIDHTAPKTTATPSGPLGSNGWYTGPVTVTLAASDANSFLSVSGVTQTLYSLDDDGFKEYPSSGIQISGAGTHTLTFYSIDGAGNIEDQNSSSNTLKVNVAYQVACLYDQTKYVKSGSTVPIKLQLTDGNGVNVSSSSIVLTALQVTNTGTLTAADAQAPGNSNPDNNFRYDAASNSYQFNLSTKGLASGAYTLSFTAGSDPTQHTVSFQVK